MLIVIWYMYSGHVIFGLYMCSVIFMGIPLVKSSIHDLCFTCFYSSSPYVDFGNECMKCTHLLVHIPCMHLQYTKFIHLRMRSVPVSVEGQLFVPETQEIFFSHSK